MTETIERDPLLALLEPFPPEMVGKLPRVTCKACSDFRSKCDEHQKKHCDTCNSYISTKHIHLDYVGHADVTRRLLEIDPAWQWDPLAEDENGLPVFDTDDVGTPVGLWIKLTVLGVTRRGYGSCPSKQTDAVKVLIGDALRNAAMRFGVALDLWAKGDRANPAAENAVAAGGRADRSRRNGNGNGNGHGNGNGQQTQAPPAEQHTDAMWLDGIRTRIAEAKSRQELATLTSEIIKVRNDGFCEKRHGEELWTLGKKRQEELDAAEMPRNKNGSTSRSRASDEQLDANGEMTSEQQKAHNKLERETLKTDQRAERATGPAADDPWASGAA